MFLFSFFSKSNTLGKRSDLLSPSSQEKAPTQNKKGTKDLCACVCMYVCVCLPLGCDDSILPFFHFYMRSASLHFSLLFFFFGGFLRTNYLCCGSFGAVYYLVLKKNSHAHTYRREKKMEESDKAKWLVEHFAMRKSERMRFFLLDTIPNYIYIQFGGVASRSLAFSFA